MCERWNEDEITCRLRQVTPQVTPDRTLPLQGCVRVVPRSRRAGSSEFALIPCFKRSGRPNLVECCTLEGGGEVRGVWHPFRTAPEYGA